MPAFRRFLGARSQPHRPAAEPQRPSPGPKAVSPRAAALLTALASVTGDFVFLLDEIGRLRWHVAPPGSGLLSASTPGSWQPDSRQPAGAEPGAGDASNPDFLTTLVRLGFDLNDGILPENGQLFRHVNGIYAVKACDLEDGQRLVVLRDVSATERLTRARHDMVANVSHDLRTPLTSLGLLADSLDTPRADESAWRAAIVQRIRGQLRSLEDLADGMVALNRIESGRALLRLEPVPVLEIVEQALTTLMPQLDARDLRVAVEVPAALHALADKPNLQRVLTNLLENAVHASPDGGKIQVSARTVDVDDSWVEIEVADRGPGIAPDEIDRIFERFFRADRARTRGGSGLGLAIARHIVEGHGGQIRAANRPQGGASLSFTLPAEA